MVLSEESELVRMEKEIREEMASETQACQGIDHMLQKMGTHRDEDTAHNQRHVQRVVEKMRAEKQPRSVETKKETVASVSGGKRTRGTFPDHANEHTSEESSQVQGESKRRRREVPSSGVDMMKKKTKEKERRKNKEKKEKERRKNKEKEKERRKNNEKEKEREEKEREEREEREEKEREEKERRNKEKQNIKENEKEREQRKIREDLSFKQRFRLYVQVQAMCVQDVEWYNHWTRGTSSQVKREIAIVNDFEEQRVMLASQLGKFCSTSTRTEKSGHTSSKENQHIRIFRLFTQLGGGVYGFKAIPMDTVVECQINKTKPKQGQGYMVHFSLVDAENNPTHLQPIPMHADWVDLFQHAVLIMQQKGCIQKYAANVMTTFDARFLSEERVAKFLDQGREMDALFQYYQRSYRYLIDFLPEEYREALLQEIDRAWYDDDVVTAEKCGSAIP